MSKRLPSSAEQRDEAVRRYYALQPLSNMELDSLLKWAARQYGDDDRKLPRKQVGEATMLTIRLLFAGRMSKGLPQSPHEGHREVRERERAP